MKDEMLLFQSDWICQTSNDRDLFKVGSIYNAHDLCETLRDLNKDHMARYSLSNCISNGQFKEMRVECFDYEMNDEFVVATFDYLPSSALISNVINCMEDILR